MSAGRRGFVLSVAFLGLAVGLCASRSAHAQPDRFHPTDPGAGRHVIWQQQLSPDQIRGVLSRFGQDDGKNDWFEKMLFDTVKDRNPGVDDEQVKAAIKRLMSDKEFMDRVTDLAQKHKNQTRNNGNDVPPKLTPEDLAKLARLRPDAPNGDPLKIPDDPNRLPPFDPRNPQFDPKKFPKIDPDNPPRFDPKTKFPLDPDTGRPFDPRTGDPIDPKNPPKIDPVPPPKVNPVDPVRPKFDPVAPPKVDPAPPPKIDPNTGRPVDPPAPPDGKRRFDPDNPLGVPNDSPDKVAKTKAVEAATALWEKNVGPIDESPAVKRAILDLVSDNEAMDALTDGKGNNIFDFLQGETGDGEKLGDWFGKGGDSGWEWPKLDLNWGRGRNLDWDVGGGRTRDTSSRDWSSRSRSGGSSYDGPGFNFGGVTVPWVLMLVLLALVTAAVLWWKWGALFQPRATAALAGGPGPWPIDPRAINSREDVVKVFEYLSVLICGPGAKTWTHSTIAEELTALAATHGGTALKLARLYELARYAPLDEPLTRAELIEARRLACDLAGVDEV
ncbi:MAG: hypothetical protein J0I06_04110 [Planctomycetes bacterium]|nr:hypothetical protein [Planctomycetota bacterium]